MKTTAHALLVAAIAFAACKDPAKDAAKATVTDTVKRPTAPAPAAEAANLEAVALTPANTKIGWVGSKVTGSHTGGFEKFSGTLSLDDKKVENSRIAVDIAIGSVTADNEKLTGHLKTGDFFLVDQFPSAKFVSTEIKAGGENGATHTISGDLTLRGVSKSISFPATIAVTADKVTAKAEFALPRKQFGVAYDGKPDDLVRDNVVVTLDVNASRAAAAAKAPAAEPAAPTEGQ